MRREAVPVVETERLVLRGWRDDDLLDYAGMVGDRRVMEWFPSTLDRVEAWQSMAMLAGHWVLRGFGMWAVEERGTARVVGRVGLHEPYGWPGLEVGWMLARDAWGQGYATEAGRAALGFAWRRLGADHVISLIRPENLRSVAVAERLGARPSGEFSHAGFRHVVYRVTRPSD